jgi:Rod binding domain-containing protein
MVPATSLFGSSSATTSGKLASAAQEFESVLVGQWLQSAESTFGSAPGGGGDADPCGEQMQNFATQRLATELTASGGIGIARLVESALVKANTRAATSQSTPGDAFQNPSSVHHIAAAESAMTAAQAYTSEAAQ